MTENQTPSPTSGKLSDKVKTMAIQAILGTVSLTAAAAIPLLVQRFLAPPTSVAPAAAGSVAAPAEIQSQSTIETQSEAQPGERERDRDRDKPRKQEDDDDD